MMERTLTASKLEMGYEVWTKEFFPLKQNPFIYLLQIMTSTLDPSLLHICHSLSELERENLTQPPPFFLYDVIHFAGFFSEGY